MMEIFRTCAAVIKLSFSAESRALHNQYCNTTLSISFCSALSSTGHVGDKFCYSLIMIVINLDFQLFTVIIVSLFSLRLVVYLGKSKKRFSLVFFCFVAILINFLEFCAYEHFVIAFQLSKVHVAL